MAESQNTTCICGLHTLVSVPSSSLKYVQQGQVQCTIPKRKAEVFVVENLDSSLADADAEPCLENALNAVAYLLESSTAFQDELAKLVVEYEVAELPISAFGTWLSQNPPLNPKLHQFLSSKQLPTIRLEADLKTKYDEDLDLYGVFDPDDSNFIYLNSALIKKAKASQDNSLSMSFLIYAKVIHELCHWVTHFTMKQEQKICTPIGFFDQESGEFMEKAMFGGIVSHHSKSAFCPWEVELVVKDKSTGSQIADFFQVDYMKLFFDKDVVDSCTQFHSLRTGAYTSAIKDRMLAIVTKVSTNDELVKPAKGKYDGHTTSISLAGVGGQDFIPKRDVLVRKRDPNVK
jgi:hypothetical protein